MSHNTLDVPRRNRAFLPKVKSGCRTCKIRKVKCDEEKPHCRRCVSTGRKCDGYASVSPARSSPPYQRDVGHGLELWLESDAERRSFHFFRSHAGQRLGGAFQTTFWSREVLQAGIHYPSIRHLIVALGSAYEQFESRSADDHFAMKQCNRSIQHLSQAQALSEVPANPSEKMLCAVTAAILFTIFASIQGHYVEARTHVRSGLRVLDELSVMEESPRSPSSQTFPISTTRLRRLLTSLYTQSRTMINEEAFLTSWTQDPLISDFDCPQAFATIDDAQAHVESLLGNSLAYFQRMENPGPPTAVEIAQVQEQTEKFKTSLNNGRSALDAFVARQSDDTAQDNKTGISLVRLYYEYLVVRLGVGILWDTTREEACDAFMPQFEKMLSLCKVIAQDYDLSLPACSLAPGIVMPLHMVAARCRVPTIRREAVQLLMNCTRKEGVWDSMLTGTVAAATIAVEDANTVDGKITRRVREIKIHSKGERMAQIEFIMDGDVDDGHTRQHQELSW